MQLFLRMIIEAKIAMKRVTIISEVQIRIPLRLSFEEKTPIVKTKALTGAMISQARFCFLLLAFSLSSFCF